MSRNIGIKTSHNVNNFLNHLIFCYHTSQCKIEGLSWMLHTLQIEIYLNEISSTWSLLMHIWELPNGLFAFVCMVTWPRIDKFLTFFFFKFFFFQICWLPIGHFCHKFSCQIYFSVTIMTKTVATWSANIYSQLNS